jgi:lambda repressor-like predicted transcriptional regulator
LPIAAQRSVVHSLLKAGLLEEFVVDDGQPAWRTTETGERFALRTTAAGQHAIGAGATDLPDVPTLQAAHSLDHKPTVYFQHVQHDTVVTASRAGSRSTLRAAAMAVVVAWDGADANRPAMPDAVAALRTALTLNAAARHRSGSLRSPRSDTKRAQVLALLRRSEGATVAQVAEATGWASHTVRGFFAGLKKQGTSIEVLSRVRQVGPGREGAKGSYTIYCIGEAN